MTAITGINNNQTILNIKNNYGNEKEVSYVKDYVVYEIYTSFLNMHKNNSKGTALEYNKRVREFFTLVLDKDVEYVSEEDVLSIKKKDIQNEYIEMLLAKGNSGKTIKDKLTSVKSFYNELLSNDIKVNPMIFKIKIATDVKHHNALSESELAELFEFMKNQKYLGFEKYLLVKTLFTTGNRTTATFNMKWNENFVVRREPTTGENINVIRIKDKGNKWIEKPISLEYYEELQRLNTGDSEYVFDFSTKTLERALKKFSEHIGKKITPHGLKATAITLGFSKTKNIELVRQLGSHSSILTTQSYLREEESLVNQLSYSMSKEIDESILDKLSHEELLDFIKDNEDIKNAILMRLNV
ncbi:site-specific integrase [Priestia megaterium]|uniref:tyrosine-type recombinase/integrase n=1 Tax=Priestia megaterium TaxID=1404 RepID=UPI002E213388|nr:site-specific integrase [Priestia megaterium]